MKKGQIPSKDPPPKANDTKHTDLQQTQFHTWVKTKEEKYHQTQFQSHHVPRAAVSHWLLPRERTHIPKARPQQTKPGCCIVVWTPSTSDAKPPRASLLPATGRTHSNKPTSSAWELVGRAWNWKTCYRWLVWRQGRRTGRDSSSTQQHLLPHLPVVRSDEGEASWSYKTPIIIIFLPLTSKCTTGVCALRRWFYPHTLTEASLTYTEKGEPAFLKVTRKRREKKKNSKVKWEN